MAAGGWIGDLAEGLGSALHLRDPVLRLGVTGLSRAGKTVFITSLVSNLLDRGRMPLLSAAAQGTIAAVRLQPQPDDTVARFDYEEHLARLTAAEPAWPQGTSRISQLRLSFRLEARGMLGGVIGAVAGPRRVHLDIVDYPGEWLLDLGLMEMDFATWSAGILARLPERPGAAAWFEALGRVDPAAPFDPVVARGLARAWSAHLALVREAGMADFSPGRFLLPGDLEGSPALTFAPLPPLAQAPRGSLWRECERRFDAYRDRIVAPFFRDHFARIDRQVVLVDVLGALAGGPRALADLRRTMAGILGAFNPGRSAWAARALGMRRVGRILFAATKADHLHHAQHPRLAALTAELLREARERAGFAGARTESMALAALRTTVEDEIAHLGRRVAVVRGRLGATGRQAALHPGDLPEDPRSLLLPMRDGAGGGEAAGALWPAALWPAAGFHVPDFAPAPLTLRPGEGLPHVRLDQAAEFLIGDWLL
ncbi:MAG: YcjX family protein [Rubellimicrobium sp.]|nr:YcjX family protein [Rubellimicrobium sp.]